MPTECNYETYNAKLLAIVELFKSWRPYLEGALYTIKVLIDYTTLRGFIGVKKLIGRQAR